MNAERLISIIDFLLKSEKTNQIQSGITALHTSLNNLVNQTNNADFQKAVAAATDALEKSLSEFFNTITPAQRKDILEIKGLPFFSPITANDIRQDFQKHGMTPAVVRQNVETLLNKRKEFIDTLKNARTNLDKLGITSENLKPGEAELGILIPRDLFHNNLEELNKELHNIIFILRAFYATSNITLERIEVFQISTSDPTFFLGIDVTVLVQIGSAVKWCIDVIGTTLKIREVVDLAKGVNASPEAIELMTDGIKKEIDKRVGEKVAEVMAGYQGDNINKTHVEGSLERAMVMLLARVERGVTIDIKLIPPPKPAEGDQKAEATRQIFEQLKEISQKLEFPRIQGQPTLQLTSVESENPSSALAETPTQQV